VLVEPMEISEAGGMVKLPELVQVVPSSGTVQLIAVFAWPTRSVKVREFPDPGASTSEIASSLAVIVAFGLNEATSSSVMLDVS
jgi:hypothetical protein